MKENSFDLLELGNLLIGIGTFVLAAVVLYVNNRNTKRSQRIHLADKRSEWIKEFSKFLTELNQVKRCKQKKGKAISNDTIRPLYDSMNTIVLLLNHDDENSIKIVEDLSTLLHLDFNEEKDYSHLIPKILKSAKTIIEKQWELIRELKE